jgi:hypothetical protein
LIWKSVDSAKQKQQIGGGQLIFEFLSKRHLPTSSMASNAVPIECARLPINNFVPVLLRDADY